MKPLPITYCLLFLLFAIACNENTQEANVKSAENPSAENITSPPPAVDSATAMKNWQEYSTPGDMHKMMASWDGNWNSEVSMWMAPGAPPEKSTATSVNKMILNGLYQTSTINGSFMNTPFTGMQTLAFDKHKKVFESIWIDNMGSGVMHMQGPWDEATKTISFKGKMVDPTTGHEVPFRQTLKIVDENTQVMEMFAPGPDGKEFKSMEIVSKRAK